MSSEAAYAKRIGDVRFSKTDINNVVLDYLINAGYPDAAAKFSQEANLPPSPIDGRSDTGTIRERVEIRDAILSGDIDRSITLINTLSPELLNTNTSLHFHLLRLQLIELIRATLSTSASTGQPPDSSALWPALQFAQTHIAPLAPTDASFLRDLEYAMALLIVPVPYTSENGLAASTKPQSSSTSTTPKSKDKDKETENAPNPEVLKLLDLRLRQDVATRVNEAILEIQGYDARSRLKGLLKARAWGERRAVKEEKAVDVPKGMEMLWRGEQGANSSTAAAAAAAGNGSVATGNSAEGDGDIGMRDAPRTSLIMHPTGDPGM